jgi:hypothetical protein
MDYSATGRENNVDSSKAKVSFSNVKRMYNDHVQAYRSASDANPAEFLTLPLEERLKVREKVLKELRKHRRKEFSGFFLALGIVLVVGMFMLFCLRVILSL